MDKILSTGFRRAWALRTVEVSIHARVADLLVSRVRVVEAGQRLRIILLRQVRDGVLSILLVYGGWNLRHLLLVCEVRFFTIAHADRVVIVVSVLGPHEALEARESGIHVHILVRHLLDDLECTGPLPEAFVLFDRVLLLLERRIPLLRVERGRR